MVVQLMQKLRGNLGKRSRSMNLRVDIAASLMAFKGKEKDNFKGRPNKDIDHLAVDSRIALEFVKTDLGVKEPHLVRHA